MPFDPPESFNIADWFLDARVRDGQADKTALVCGERRLSYREVQALAARFGHLLRELGLEQEQRVVIALPDVPEWVGAFFGILKIGAVVVMVNPGLPEDDIAYFFQYTRARVAVVASESLGPFAAAAQRSPWMKRLLVVGPDAAGHASFDREAGRLSDRIENAPTHRDDPAIWLFSGGTTGRPKAVVQTHTSFANTTELYAKGVIGYRESDVTLSVPKLYFGYATGSNLLFPFAAGATAVIFPERATADSLFARIQAHRPTILVNVPTMIHQMAGHPEARRQDLSCLRLATSAGEALPVALHQRWNETFGVELLDGLGTAEMWHIFLSNRPGHVRPGTLGQVVPGFEVRLVGADGQNVPPGEPGALWVRGNSRAIQYWHEMPRTRLAFQGEWYVSGDILTRDAEGYFSYCGRGDDMLKVSGKWLSPQEVENCLLRHPAVKEVVVVGATDAAGLVKPCAFVVPAGDSGGGPELALELQAFVKRELEPYKYPREVLFREALPRTHLGKVDRGRLRREASPGRPA